ncbi:UDP-N-acetylmuramoyl-L-alanyl-D-glutamate--2,6-diaminopimelate ligase [Candidatus Midichloria mitochondrii]|uniref:UDP-N-acetylmuramoyl-L-alanyl-D-glutamate--2,6-diaminopimelate ligase n=1 Tax=Midichloria mitochondrii (strain IricVA) TaxID=696127 RepID=F7XV36_MIDMI|nr:UDP-N-acetylmuramoyl-L-alanyl-D-glutamate--2,6-diaminopimelate ligase [Candidatus Midichloria mitochondrii]AEI88535.1 UDP-N-acetylmuramoylalanyl-D-glutamate--2,6-diaminopimelate ligase [Candidatus Midichloria mitochondrii IricVA]
MKISVKNILTEIKGISANSRLIENGYAYVAMRGAKFNGEDFIEEAVKRGAKYIILQNNNLHEDRNRANFIYVDNPRQTLSQLASSFYVPQPANIVTVTGTNGKTSTANLFMQLTNTNHYKSAAIGTLGLTSFDALNGLEDFLNHDSALTSPDSVTTNNILYNLAKNNFTHVAIESSSHGLSQYRLDGINFKAAGFTNLSRDHLDYHGTMAAYFNAKKRLFSEVIGIGTTVVLNSDIPEFNEIYQLTKARGLKVIEYGKNARDIRIIAKNNNTLKLALFGKKIESVVQLTGEFQLYNLTCAIGLSIGCGLNESQLVSALPNLKSITGRVEKIAAANLRNDIFIDYAHTPDALKKVLSDLKHVCNGRLILVFGCGGDRDQGKRQIMGIIAEEYADVNIVTDDNPRNEDPALIRKEIMASMKNPVEIGNRKEAIHYAISILQPQDIILIAGKGHENYQIIGNEKIYFSDREIVLSAV